MAGCRELALKYADSQRVIRGARCCEHLMGQPGILAIIYQGLVSRADQVNTTIAFQELLHGRVSGQISTCCNLLKPRPADFCISRLAETKAVVEFIEPGFCQLRRQTVDKMNCCLGAPVAQRNLVNGNLALGPKTCNLRLASLSWRMSGSYFIPR